MGIEEFFNMNQNIHPNYQPIQVVCSCGEAFQTASTVGRDLSIEVCSKCHPFYTGKQKIVDTAGRVEKFKERFRRGTVKSKSEAKSA